MQNKNLKSKTRSVRCPSKIGNIVRLRGKVNSVRRLVFDTS